jgi:hypothetical protein
MSAAHSTYTLTSISREIQMFFKVLVVILFIANIVALGSALVTLLKDQGRGGQRTARLLLIRVSLAAALLIVIAIGFYTGDLGVSAPWLGERDEIIPQ